MGFLKQLWFSSSASRFQCSVFQSEFATSGNSYHLEPHAKEQNRFWFYLLIELVVSCRIFHSGDLAGCNPMVSFNMFLWPSVSYKLVEWYGNPGRLRIDILEDYVIDGVVDCLRRPTRPFHYISTHVWPLPCSTNSLMIANYLWKPPNSESNMKAFEDLFTEKQWQRTWPWFLIRTDCIPLHCLGVLGNLECFPIYIYCV